MTNNWNITKNYFFNVIILGDCGLFQFIARWQCRGILTNAGLKRSLLLCYVVVTL